MKLRKLESGELPPKFSIDNYRFTKQLDGAGWGNAVALRYCCQYHLELACEYSSYRESSIRFTQILVDAPMDATLDGWKPHRYEQDSETAVSDYSVLQFLDLATVISTSARAHELQSKYQVAQQRPSDEGLLRQRDAARADLLAAPFWRLISDNPTGSEAVASVNLEAPDHIIIEEFGEWLTNARRTREIQNFIPTIMLEDLDKWSDMRVLAYLDLTLWASARSVRIPLPIIGRALFPDEFAIGLEDRVRKVIARAAAKLCTPQTIKALFHQRKKLER